MRKYCYRETNRNLRKHEFALERDTRFDERYYKSLSSPFRYYTEPRNDIMEKWIGQEWYSEYDDNDRKLFAYLKRCYTLGMLIVNDVDLRSAYSCLRANPSSVWADKIKDLLGNVLDLGCRGAEKSKDGIDFTGARSILVFLKENQHEPKVINPSPEIIWRDDTEEIYWTPHQHEDFNWHEQFQDYLDRELLDKEFRKIANKKKREDAIIQKFQPIPTISKFIAVE